jgi:mono/diheme cytochrome c family protein
VLWVFVHANAELVHHIPNLGFMLIFAKLWGYLKNKTKKISELVGAFKKILEAFFRSCAACHGIAA